MSIQDVGMPDGTASTHLYLPKLVTTALEGYTPDRLRKDALAGLTVAIVALPLSMAIAVASGVGPERGLYAAIIGGVLVSALGGSRFQIGGPAGAFIVLVAATVGRFGIDGLLLAVLLSGLMLAVVGAVGLGKLIRHIPHPVTIGFTGGIAVTILASQLKDLGGLRLGGEEPAALIPKLSAIAHSLSTMTPSATAVGVAVVGTIFALRRIRPSLPGMLIAVGAASIGSALLHLPIETIGSRFGGIPHGLPTPRLPDMSWPLVWSVLPAAVSFTLLGGIESLLSARVADGMTGRQHRSNMELVAQGVANLGSAVFGGICVTGAIARTATNIRAGAQTPLSGVMHSAFLLLFMLIAAPLASYVPLAALAGVLVVVAWNMVEKDQVADLMLDWRNASVLITTFALTLLHDLTAGIAAGCGLAALMYWIAPRSRREPNGPR